MTSKKKNVAKLARKRLIQGNERFVENAEYDKNLAASIHNSANGQNPFALVLSCIDSRIPTEQIFDQGVGAIFNARVAGNFVNEDIEGSIEFACGYIDLIVVLGHTGCGAVNAACRMHQPDFFGAPLVLPKEAKNLINMVDKFGKLVRKNGPFEDEEKKEYIDRVAKENVNAAVKQLRKNKVVAQKSIKVVGAMYDVSSGKVKFI